MTLSGPETRPQGAVRQLVIFLHGLGSNGNDLLSLAPFFAPAMPRTAFLSPNAPLVVPFATSGFQWFEYWDRSAAQIKAGLDSASLLLKDYIAKCAETFAIETKNIVLCGFSQGTMMALHAGLTLPIGGIIGFSGALLDADIPPARRAMPILLVHGALDDVVPYSASVQAKDVLTSAGYDVELLERPALGHSIDEMGIQAAVQFCQAVFNGV